MRRGAKIERRGMERGSRGEGEGRGPVGRPIYFYFTSWKESGARMLENCSLATGPAGAVVSIGSPFSH